MNPYITAAKAEKLLSFVALAALAACGGGGGDSPSTAAVPVPAPGLVTVNSTAGFPTTGSYQRLFTAEGPNTALRSGLSLIHPSDRTVEYEIETTNPISGS